jgi:hypothetical protein
MSAAKTIFVARGLGLRVCLKAKSISDDGIKSLRAGLSFESFAGSNDWQRVESLHSSEQ